MSEVVIVGAGEIGGAVAHALARRAVVNELTIVDERVDAARGKALDIQQSGPIEHFETRLTATSDVLAAAGARVIVVADALGQGEWQAESGLALIRRLVTAGTRATFVFAGPRQMWLMETAARELAIPVDRLIGSAATALAGAARALVALDLNGSGVDVQLTLAGRPPAIVIGWSTATVNGSPISDRLPAHRLLAISQTVERLWPIGPYAIASSTAVVVQGLLQGSRQLIPALAMFDGELGLRRVAGILPLELGQGRIVRRVTPVLSPQERTEAITKLSR